jgi:hypothetical protein
MTRQKPASRVFRRHRDYLLKSWPGGFPLGVIFNRALRPAGLTDVGYYSNSVQVIASQRNDVTGRGPRCARLLKKSFRPGDNLPTRSPPT